MLIIELSDRTFVETYILGSDGGFIKLAGDIIDSGKISLPLFMQISSFLYSSCKASQKIVKYFSESHVGLIKRLNSLLINKESGNNSEILVVVGGLLYSLFENIASADEKLLAEIIRILKTVIEDTNPKQDYICNIEKHIKEIADEAKKEEEVEEIRKIMEQKLTSWNSIANSNTIALEILAELFSTEDDTMEMEYEEDKNQEEGEEDLKMDYAKEIEKDASETKADILLNATFLNAIFNKSLDWSIPNEEQEQLKSLREASDIFKKIDKIRIKAFDGLLNLLVNRTKKIGALLSPYKDIACIIINFIQEISLNASKDKVVFEKMSGFIKLAFEKYGEQMSSTIQKLVKPENLISILQSTLNITNENVQLNMISIFGNLLKYVPHSKDINKVNSLHNNLTIANLSIIFGISIKGKFTNINSSIEFYF